MVLSGKRFLVTGGAGFIGSHLANSTVPDHELTVLDALTTGERGTVPDEVTLVEADIRDADAVATAAEVTDVIFHEAALVSVEASVDDPDRSHAINVQGTINVLEAARYKNIRVVLASSAAIYGHPESIPISEDHPKEPTSPYGLDKLSTDQYARLYNDLYDLETVSLRYFNVYGPEQVAGDYSGVISVFIDQALSGEDITVHGSGEQTRDFVYIDDIVQANLIAATTDAVGEAYNVGTGESVTIRELAELIQDITDTDSDIVHTDARTGDIEHSRADISKAKEYLEYDPNTSLREGLKQTVEWYQNQQD